MRREVFSVVAALVAGAACAGESWPQFRGPTCDGHADAANLPVTWSESSHVAWKTAVHGRGWSSPVIWGRQVWMTTATPDGKEMFVVCVDRRTGKVVRDVKLFDVAKPEKINGMNSYASPTPAVEAGRLYAHFGTYGTACVDTATGKAVWVRRDLNCDHAQGPGSSVLLYGKLLVLTYDGMDVQYLAALDKATGKTVWKAERSTDFGTLDGDFRKAYCTPTVIDVAGGKQLVSCGAQAAMAYDPDTGRELWKVRYKGGYSNVSRPVLAAGLVLIDTGFSRAKLLAVRPGGRGDVTDTHVAWTHSQSVPLKPSLAAVDGLVYMTSDTGTLTCLEAATGEELWRQRLRDRFSASPVVVGKRIYFVGERGTSWVIEAGRQYKQLGENKLDEGCMASPAVAGEALFIRTKTHLYRIQR